MKKGFKFEHGYSQERIDAMAAGYSPERRHLARLGSKHSAETKRKIKAALQGKFNNRVPRPLLQRGITADVYFESIRQGLKWCWFHEKFEPLSLFSSDDPRAKRPCIVGMHEYDANRIRKKPTRAQHRRSVLRKYKVTPEWYEEKLAAQGSACPLCQKLTTGVLHVDHDHECCPTRRICGKCNRGLLCLDCNHKIGHLEIFREMAGEIKPLPNTWLERALAYLESYRR